MKSLLESIFGKKEDIVADAKDMISWPGWDETIKKYIKDTYYYNDNIVYDFEWIPTNKKSNILREVTGLKKWVLKFTVSYEGNYITIYAGRLSQGIAKKEERKDIKIYGCKEHFNQMIIEIAKAFRRHPGLIQEIIGDDNKFEGKIQWPEFEKNYINK